MRFLSPFWGFVVLILAAVIVSAVVSSKHTNNGALPPAEQAQLDEQKQAEEAKKQAGNNASKSPAAPKTADDASAQTPDTTPMTFDQVKEGAVKVTMNVKDRGTIVMELYPKAAPKTVAHFLDLTKKKFYDGLKFHRLEPGFVVQGGDPKSKDASVEEFETKGIGSHGSGTTVPLEAHLPHKKYSVGLARSNAPDSGDSQFYINFNDNTSLDGKYCVFGMVVQGQDVVDKLQKGDAITSLTAQ